MPTVKQTIEALIKKHNGLRSAARAVDMDPAYLLRLRDGDKQNPSEETLKKLGLRVSLSYDRR